MKKLLSTRRGKAIVALICSMAVLVTVVWLGMVGVSALIEKRAKKKAAAKA